MICNFKCIVLSPEIKSVDITSFFFWREIEIGPAILKQLFTKSSLIVLKCVWPKVEPDKSKGIGRLVFVVEF